MQSLTRREALRAAAMMAPLALLARGGEAAAAFAGLPFAEMQLGAGVGRCTLVAIHPVTAGGVPVLLKAPDGHVFQVDVLRHDPASPGIARAGSLAVYVRNGGRGTTATNEEEGLGAIALAELLARREAKGFTVPRLGRLRDRSPR